MLSPPMTFGSACSGIGAPEQAWKPLGWKLAFMSEVAAFPRAVLKFRHRGIPLHGDFTTIQDGDYDPIDLLVGGTPCQGFSVAGLRGGLGDDRGNLALEYLRLAGRLRPRWLVFENVPGLFSSLSHDAPDPRPPEIDLDASDGPADGEEVVVEDSYDADESHAFACFLAGLSELGYGFAYRVFDAQHVRTRVWPRAVPQRRRRVFVVGYFGDWRPPAAVLFERESLLGHPAPRREAGEGSSGPIAPSLTGSGRGVARPGESRGQDPVVAVAGGDAPSLNATYGEQTGQDYANGLMVAHTLKGEGFDASEDGTGRGTPLGPAAMAFGGNDTRGPIAVETAINAHGGPHGRLDFESETFIAHGAFQATGDGYYREGRGPLAASDDNGSNQLVAQAVSFALRGRDEGAVPEVEGGGDAAGALRAASGGSTRDYVAFTCSDQANGFAWERDHYPTLSAQTPSDTSNIQIGVRPHAGVRRLTPNECARLMAFPDHFAQVPWRGKSAPDGPMYKAYGNSIAGNVIGYIGERIDLVEQILRDIADA